MPHSRRRFIIENILKKIKYSPIVAIQGARQTGKSFFVSEILKKHLENSVYLSFDDEPTRSFAQKDISNFLVKYSDFLPTMIDEAQKVPALFDQAKFIVDQKRIPGTYLLLGSTEFSKLHLIRESLTGRMTRVRFFPMTLAEAHEQPFQESTLPFFLSPKPMVDRGHLMRHLEQGGLPAIFSIRDSSLKQEALKDWIDLTIHRDIHQFPKLKLSSELCRKILLKIAQLPEPSAGQLAKELHVDLRRIKTHLSALETLFVVQAITPHAMGTGKPIYYLLDVGIANFLGADMHKQLETLFLQEYLAKQSFASKPPKNQALYYYRSSHGGRVSFVEERDEATSAIQIISDSQINRKNFYTLEALRTKFLEKKLALNCLALTSHSAFAPIPNVTILPWESMG